PRGIYRVEQVFDVRTAPVKRVDKLKVGAYDAMSVRHSQTELQMTAFSEKAQKDDESAGGGAGTTISGPPGGMGISGPPPGPGGPASSGIGVGGPSGPSVGGASESGTDRTT